MYHRYAWIYMSSLDRKYLCGVHTTVPSGTPSGVVSGVHRCVRHLSGVCPTFVGRTVKVGRNAGPSGGRVRRTEGVAIIARDVMTFIVMT